MRVWKISPWFKADDWTVFLNERCIYVGDFKDEDLGDLRNYATKEDLKRQSVSGSAANQLWSFYDEMKKNDVVVAYSKNTIWGLGRIVGNYDRRTIRDIRDGRDYELHVRDVKWAELRPPLNVEKDEVLFGSPPRKYGALNRQRTVIELDDEVWNHILKYPEVAEKYKQLA